MTRPGVVNKYLRLQTAIRMARDSEGAWSALSVLRLG
jgi:hypothetical protein